MGDTSKGNCQNEGQRSLQAKVVREPVHRQVRIMVLHGLETSHISRRKTCSWFISIATLIFWIVSADFRAMGQSTTSFLSQSKDGTADSGNTDDKASQRWIPVDRRKLGELGRLGELLQNPPRAVEDTETTNPSDTKPSRNQQSLPIDLSKVDLRSLEERLASLSPEQRERLKKLASQLSNNETVRDLSSAFKDLPPALVDQVRESPALRKFAEEVLDDNSTEGSTKDSDFFSFDDSNNQPWIKFDPSNSSLRTEKETKAETTNADGPDKSADISTNPKKGTESQPQRNGTIPSDRNNDSNRYNGSNKLRSAGGGTDQRNQEQPLSNGSRGSNDFRNGALRQPSRNTQSPRNPRPQLGEQSARVGANSVNQKPETAFEVFKRRVGELGLGQTFEKLAKEAVGIDKSREATIDNASNSDQVNREASRLRTESERNSRSEIASKKKASELEQREPKAAKERNQDFGNQKESNQQASAQNQSSPPRSPAIKQETQPKPSSPSKAESDNMSSTWRAPTWQDLPKFSFWHLAGLLLLLLLVGGFIILNRTPEFVKSVAQKRREDRQRAQLIDMEIVNREQVVLAFDTFVARQLRSFEDWWTSQRVVKHVADRKMIYSKQLQAAEQVYKHARYSPPDQELSEEELSTVRDAIRECAKSRDTE
jgi:hypothetical protein